MRHELGRDEYPNNTGHTSPIYKTADELKTNLLTLCSGIEKTRNNSTDVNIESRGDIPNEIKRKIAFTCDIDEESVIEAVDAPTIYQVPLNFKIQDILNQIAKHLNLENVKPDMREWHKLVRRIVEPQQYRTKIAFVGTIS